MADPPNSPDQELLQIPPSPIHQDFSHSSRRLGGTEYHNGELKIREQKVRHDFRSGHLSVASTIDETGLLWRAKIYHSSQSYGRSNLLQVG